ncbi:hypothetical protein VU07_02340 [Desulfobulbus sp. F4]|nr:hypothetical protein [Desulfobulbus sp. F4]
MDPLTSAGLFATIIGLLCNYKSERSSTDLNEFMRWLEEKHHETIAASIQNNAELENNLTSFLNIKHEELVGHLQRLDLLFASVAGKLDEFSGIAKAIHRKMLFSMQAVSILTQLVDSGAECFIESAEFYGTPYPTFYIIGGNKEKIEYEHYGEARFVEDDLNTLINNKLLRLSISTGRYRERKFHITRSAALFITELKKKSSQ